MTRSIVFWADGTYCDADEVETYTHRSDDYGRLEVDWEASDLDIQRAVNAASGCCRS